MSDLIFPVQHKFADAMEEGRVLLLDTDCEFFGKHFSAGTTLRIVGWRDMKEVPYLLVARDTWEGIVPFKEVSHMIQKKI